mmetsp:Transcript_7926/g.17844  ORF Transcript_7926/g.17844 Transcript_7926/m.17844 type:complete len:206 (+) Transcript_7926:382-999(+)
MALRCNNPRHRLMRFSYTAIARCCALTVAESILSVEFCLFNPFVPTLFRILFVSVVNRLSYAAAVRASLSACRIAFASSARNRCRSFSPSTFHTSSSLFAADTHASTPDLASRPSRPPLPRIAFRSLTARNSHGNRLNSHHSCAQFLCTRQFINRSALSATSAPTSSSRAPPPAPRAPTASGDRRRMLVRAPLRTRAHARETPTE